MMPTVVHVTHEAVVKVGGIGAVLHGLLTSPVYLNTCPRNILVGTYWPGHDEGYPLGSGGEVLYSTFHPEHQKSLLAPRFREIEQKYNIGLVYGRRAMNDKDTGVSSNPEIILIDITRADPVQVGVAKFELWKNFGLESAKYEHIFDFDQWVRIAKPAIDCLHAIDVGTRPNDPAIILAHEYMGLPTALMGIADPIPGFRAIFHAHEVATMRRIVEHKPGHDTMFYNVLRRAIPEGKFVEDVFGPQDDYYKHAVVRCARFCDGIFAVGDEVLREIRFMGSEFMHVDAQVAYNGVPCWKIDNKRRTESRRKMQRYTHDLLGFTPDYVFSHVTRLVTSKGLWRDLRVLEHLEPMLSARGETAIMFALSTEMPQRKPDDVLQMESQYGWPVVHREGAPDLSAGEAGYYEGVQAFNAKSRAIKVIFINQFGFDRTRCGMRVPEDVEFMDMRVGSDVEFGQSIYEPFGIAQVEPISFGGICVFSSVCGCEGFVSAVSGTQPTPNVIVADYTELDHKDRPLEDLLHIGQYERDIIEHRVAEQVAGTICERLPRNPADFERYIERGYELASQMSWDAVATAYILPGFKRAIASKRLQQLA